MAGKLETGFVPVRIDEADAPGRVRRVLDRLLELRFPLAGMVNIKDEIYPEEGAVYIYYYLPVGAYTEEVSDYLWLEDYDAVPPVVLDPEGALDWVLP